MSARHLVEVDADLIETIAFANPGIEIERSADEQRMFVRLDDIEFWAPSPNEVTV